MDLPGWTTVDDTHVHDGYVIEPADCGSRGGWVIRVHEAHHPVIASIGDAHFSSLRAAKAAVIHHEVLVTRRTKMIRHAFLAMLGVIVAIPAFWLMGPGESTRRVAFFAIGLVILLLTLRELVGLLVLTMSHGWDYAYDKPDLTIVDRALADVVVAVGSVPTPDSEAEGASSVHVVPLERGHDGQ